MLEAVWDEVPVGLKFSQPGVHRAGLQGPFASPGRIPCRFDLGAFLSLGLHPLVPKPLPAGPPTRCPRVLDLVEGGGVAAHDQVGCANRLVPAVAGSTTISAGSVSAVQRRSCFRGREFAEPDDQVGREPLRAGGAIRS